MKKKIFKSKVKRVSLGVTFDDLKDYVLSKLKDEIDDRSRISFFLYNQVTPILNTYRMDGSWSLKSPLPSSPSSTRASGISRMSSLTLLSRKET